MGIAVFRIGRISEHKKTQIARLAASLQLEDAQFHAAVFFGQQCM
jgi:hypothetical protein